jgi:hypothetical protein
VTSAFGFQRVRLDGTVEITQKTPTGHPGLLWRPSKAAEQFIASVPRHQWGQQIGPDFAARLKEAGWAFEPPTQRILCRIGLRSALIFAKGEQGPVYLNAEHLGVVGPITNRELMVRERDPQRAGDLDIFVYLVPENFKIIERQTTRKGKKKQLGVADPKSLAPFYPTPQDVVVRMLELGGLKRGERLFDIGSGDGRLLIAGARKFGAVATGVESNKELWQQASKAIKRAKQQKKARTVLGDATDHDLSKADLVTMYLMPSGNDRIRPILEKQLKPGTRVVSHDFEIAGWDPTRTERVEDGDGRGHTLFLYSR